MRQRNHPNMGQQAMQGADKRAEMIDLSDPRPARLMTGPRVCAVLVVIMGLKGVVLTLMGESAYNAMVAQLEAGSLLARFVGVLLFADPITVGFSELWQGTNP